MRREVEGVKKETGWLAERPGLEGKEEAVRVILLLVVRNYY